MKKNQLVKDGTNTHTGKINKQIEKHTADIIKRFKIMKIDEQIADNNKKIKSDSDDNHIMELMRLNKELQLERKSVLSHDELSTLNL